MSSWEIRPQTRPPPSRAAGHDRPIRGRRRGGQRERRELVTAVRIIFFLSLCMAAAIAMLLLFPGLKEGTSQSELPLYLGTAGGLAVFAFAWWFVCGKSRAKTIVGCLVLALPFGLHLLLTALLILANIEGRRLPGRVTITDYRETPIQWPGFDGPVGLDVELELTHPKGTKGVIYAPEIRMSPALTIPRSVAFSTLTSGGGYFKDGYLEQPVGDLAILKSVLFQELYPERFANRRFEPGERTRLTYHLFPGTLETLVSEDKICLASESFGLPACAEAQAPETGCAPAARRRTVTNPILHDGAELHALWLVAGAYDMVADISPLLNDQLRNKSQLQGNPDIWAGIMRRLEPASLTRAGYRLCPPGRESHTAFRTCYCRP